MDGLQEAEGALADDVGGIGGDLKGDLDVALRAQVIDLIGADGV
jgi:hypothetical protein